MKSDFYLRIFVVSIIFAVVSQGVHTVAAFLEMKYYLMPEYFPVWSSIMMPTPGPPPFSFTILSLMASMITGVIYSFTYVVIMKWIPGATSIKKGVNFGALLFFVGVVPSSLSMMLLINLPMALVMYWMLEGLIISVIGGILMVKIIG